MNYPNTATFSQRLRLVGAAIALGLLVLPAARQATAAPHKAPDGLGQVMLIKNALTAINHGNITGNFTVLRDLGSPRFRQQHSAADLAMLFAALREAKLDLSPILVIDPKLTRPAELDEFRGRLRLTGYCPTKPHIVRFVLVFQYGESGWGIDEVSLALAVEDQASRAELPRRAPPPQPHHSPHRASQIPQPAAYSR